MIFLGVLNESIFPFMQYFFSQENCVSFGLLYLLLIAELISLDTSGKPTVGFLENYFSLLNSTVNLT